MTIQDQAQRDGRAASLEANVSAPVAMPGGTSSFHRTLERVALGLVGLGCVALVWYHRVVIDTAFVPAIIDEYWITVCARWINDGLLPYRDFFQFHFPGSYYLYAMAERCFGGGMTAMRALNSAVAVLLGVTLAVWYRMHGRGLAASLGVALLVSGPCFYLWPVISPRLPGMLALAVACVLLFRSTDVGRRVAWLIAGALLFFAGWTVQTLAVLAVATLVGALLGGVEGATRRRWAPWVVAGAVLPLAVWIGSLLAAGQWGAFLRQAVSFVVDDGYKQAGGINDVNLFAQVVDRVGREVGWSKLLVAGAASACVVGLWVAPIAGLWQWRSTRRSLLLPAAIAPFVFLSGRTDAHHAFYLCVPGLLILATPRWEGRGGRLVRRLGLTAVAGIAFVFFLATMPHLRGALQAGLTFGDDSAPAREAIEALARLGVEPGDPVAVMPWAANLYYYGVVPGHRFTFVSPAQGGYQGEREWQELREQMHASRTRWIAFYPASSAGAFLVDGRPADYLTVEGTVPVRVGRSGPIELWRLDPAVGASLTGQASVP
jgi:hypothetical protein